MKNQSQTRKGKGIEKNKNPLLNSLRGDYSIPNNVKTKLGIYYLLRTTANSWTNIEALLEAYFENCLMWEKK